MNDRPQDRPTPRYIRTIFHLGLFGLLCLLFRRMSQSKGALIVGTTVLLAAILPYYPAIWVSRIKSQLVVIVLLLALVVANIYLIYLEVNPN